MKYSIIYAVIRPEIQERLSVGIIIVDGDQIDMRYSQEKLDAIKALFPEKVYNVLLGTVTSMKSSKSLASVDAVNYLTRYSNNLITVSPLESIDVECTKENKDMLFRSYVFDGLSATA